jgi:hypothetical protein
MKRLIPFIAIFFVFTPTVFHGQQIENPGFESWEAITSTISEPLEWNSIKTADDEFIASVAPVTYDTSFDAHTGNYALKLYNVKAFGLIATGAICNGRFHAEFNLDDSYSYTDPTDAQWHTPITYRPDSLAGWFKYFPQEDDRAQFKVILHVGECKLPENGTLGNWIGMAVYNTTSSTTYENWTRFSVPFEYYSDGTPENLLCVINSGDSTDAAENSYLLVDDLELIYNNAGIHEHATEKEFLAVYPDHVIFTIPEHEYQGSLLHIADLSGRILKSTRVTGQRAGLPSGLETGIYLAVLQNKEKRYSQKILIR